MRRNAFVWSARLFVVAALSLLTTAQDCEETCPDDGNPCTASGAYTIPGGLSCESYDKDPGFPDGTTCLVGPDFGVCEDEVCIVGGYSPPAQTKTFKLGCRGPYFADLGGLSPFLDVQLTVDPAVVSPNASFDAEVRGKVIFPEVFLDAAAFVIFEPPFDQQLQTLIVRDSQMTVQVRQGATGASVVLQIDKDALRPGPVRFCNVVTSQTCTQDSDCPVGLCDPPVGLASVPTSTDCDIGGICESLGKTAQCSAYGYCVTGSLELPLEPVSATFTAEASGPVLIGLDDEPSTTGPLNPDGTYALPTYAAADPMSPNSILFGAIPALGAPRVDCAMAVESDGPDGVGVPNAFSPTPDGALISFELVSTPYDSLPVTKTIPAACSDTAVGAEPVFMDVELTVDASAFSPGGAFTADLTGTAFFPRSILDFAQAFIAGGLRSGLIDDSVVTVLVRDGATGDAVEMQVADPPPTCENDPGAGCDPAQNGPTGNPACDPFTRCDLYFHFPTSNDCVAAGLCEMIGAGAQCAANGFCITGPLPLPLVPTTGAYQSEGLETVLFGLDDRPLATWSTLSDGSYIVPFANASSPPAAVGLRYRLTDTGSVFAFEGAMAVDDNGARDAPDDALLAVVQPGGTYDPAPQGKVITLGCADSSTASVNIMEVALTVDPGPLAAGQSFSATLGGEVTVPAVYLDTLQQTVPGGAAELVVQETQFTVTPRQGATGFGRVTVEIPGATCQNNGAQSCTTSGPGCTACDNYYRIPTSNDCASAGFCDLAGRLDQCTSNGFCVAGDLTLPFTESTWGFNAQSVGPILFGLADAPVVNLDGTFNLPAPTGSTALGENGLRLVAVSSAPPVAIECGMAVDANGVFGVGAPGEASPTPDSELISFPLP